MDAEESGETPNPPKAEYVTHKQGHEAEMTGYVGECLVQLELAKQGIRVHKIPDGFKGIDCDFITSSAKRLEVKTGRLKRWKGKDWKEKGSMCWGFSNSASYVENVPEVGQVMRRGRRKHVRQADFYVLVCLEREPKPDYKPKGFFIIPAEEVGDKMTLHVFPEDFSSETGRSKWFKYRNNWTLLQDH